MMDILALLQWFNPTHSNTNLRSIGRIVFALLALMGRVSMLSISSTATLRNFDVDGIANPWRAIHKKKAPSRKSCWRCFCFQLRESSRPNILKSRGGRIRTDDLTDPNRAL